MESNNKLIILNIKTILWLLIPSLLFFYSKSSNTEELKDVLVDAYNFYPDVKKSLIEFDNAKKDLTIAKTDFLPSLDLSATQGKDLSKSFPDTSNYGVNTINPTTLDIDLTQPLGATKVLNLKKSKNSLKMAQYENYSVIQNVLFKASKAYYTVLKDYFLLDVSKKNEQNLEMKLDATEKRFEFKDVTRTDVFQAKARLAEATSKRIEAENNLEISISDFKNIVGRTPRINWYDNSETKIISSNPKDWSKFAEIPKIPDSLKQAIEIGRANNPEFNKIKLEIENSKIDVTSSGLNFVPELSISGSVGKSLESSRTVERKDSFSVTAQVSLPLFNKGHNLINVQKSKNTALTKIRALETKNLDLEFQIKSFWKQIESTKSSIDSLEVSVESNLIAVEGVTREASVGTRTTIEILDAEKELTQSESNLVNAQYQLIISSFELLKQCGLLNFDYLN